MTVVKHTATRQEPKHVAAAFPKTTRRLHQTTRDRSADLNIKGIRRTTTHIRLRPMWTCLLVLGHARRGNVLPAPVLRIVLIDTTQDGICRMPYPKPTSRRIHKTSGLVLDTRKTLAGFMGDARIPDPDFVVTRHRLLSLFCGFGCVLSVHTTTISRRDSMSRAENAESQKKVAGE